MRKSAAITLLLFILSAAGLLLIHGRVNAARDGVVLTETALSGDRAAAEGVRLTLRTHCDYRLFWDTDYTVGDPGATHTDFTFTQAQAARVFTRTSAGVQLNMYGDYGVGGSGLDLTSGAYSYGIISPVRAVAGRTAPGEAREEIIRLRDYYTFYPAAPYADIPEFYVAYTDENGGQTVQQASGDHLSPLGAALADFFKIPVPGGHRVEIHVEKDLGGNVVAIGMWSREGAEPNMWTKTVTTEAGCFFAVNNRTTDGSLIDMSHVPGGYGIYLLPAVSDGTYSRIVPEDLSMVFPMDDRAQLVTLETTAGGERLLLVTREGGGLYLTVIDAGTTEELQKLRLFDYPEDEYHAQLFNEDGFFAAVTWRGRLALAEKTDSGLYALRFETRTDLAPEDYFFHEDTVLRWDGTKLYAASFQRSIHRSDFICGFNLCVYDETGLLYHGRYDSSLDTGAPDRYSDICRPVDDMPLCLTMPGGGE